MKKRLLITSIVMMLVVAVALSTATYAWFTSNNAVTASTLTMTAATNDASALGIDWIGGSSSGASSEIVFNGTAEQILPMVPETLTVGTTTSAVAFATSTVKSVDGHLVFNSNGESATPFTFGDGTSSAFYVSNLSTANAVANVQVQATITSGAEVKYTKTTDVALQEKTYYTRTGSAPNYYYTEVTSPNVENIGNYYEKSTVASPTDGTDLIRIAIFKRDTAGSGDYKLMGVLAKTADSTAVAYGTITSGSNAEKNPTGATASLSYGAAVDYIDLGGLAVNNNAANGLDQMDIVAIVWMDGYALNDDNQGKSAVISLTFLKTAAGAKG